jgi:probable LLM family oxidoreductase
VRVSVQFGLDTFGDITKDAEGNPLTAAQTIRNVVEQAKLADEVGLDFFGVGEHHRAEYAVSSPEMVLAGIAGQTKNISLGTAVTVLSSDDPIRVYERFATLDAISNGRAEVVVGRGSFIESFPLFGFDLSDYERLFEEKLELLVEVMKGEPVTWSGTIRPPLNDVTMFPKTEGEMPLWVGVGGSPESAVRVARYGVGLMLAIIGGPAARFRPFVDLYHRSVETFGTKSHPIAVHSPGHIASTDEEAWDAAYPSFELLNNSIGKERGWPAYSRARFQQEVGSEGAVYAGSPDRVAKKIAETIQILGAGRFDLKYANGDLSHELMMQSIELYGTEVVPRVRAILAKAR